jgi:prevent-host-death family protein
MENNPIGSNQVRDNFAEVLTDVEHGDWHVTVMRYKKPAAVIVPVEWYREVCSLVADIGEWLVAAWEDQDRMAGWQSKANAVRRDIPKEDDWS